MAADSDVSFDLTVTTDKAFDRQFAVLSLPTSSDSSFSTCFYDSIFSGETSTYTYDPNPLQFDYSFRLFASVDFDSSMQYLVVDLPNLYADGSFFPSGSFDLSPTSVRFINISDISGEWTWTELSRFDESSSYFNSNINRYLIPVSEIPSGCNGFYLNTNTDVNLPYSSYTFYYDQAFAFCIVSTLEGGSSAGGVTEDYINAALAGQTSELKQSLTSAINDAQQSNQDFLNDQYSQSIGTLPEDTAETDSMIDNLDQQEDVYKSDALDRFNELSSTFSGFEGNVASGIGLAGTLFSRFFNALGSYKIIYTFPLLLGLALVIIGRLGRSNFRTEREPGDQFKIDGW